MIELERAVDALKAAVKQESIDKRVSDVVSQFASYLVLLKSSSPSSQSISKLRSILRRPLVPLYTDFPEPALQLSSAVLHKVIDEKLRNALSIQDSQLIASWNEVAVALLSGVLDYLEKKCDDMSKETTASAFYPTICTLFFYQDTTLTLFPRTQTTAYSLLHDTLVKHPGNQRRLRDHAVLGGSLIGFAISQSKDYLVIEPLLNIVGWLIPATHKTEQGMLKRTEFIQELFGSDKLFSCSQELVKILRYISSSHWEDTTMKITDTLARSDIMFPQPFALNEVDVCGKSYAQPTPFDRLHLDRDCFLVGVIEKDDVCESLKIPYIHIRSITINTSNPLPPDTAAVHADLIASPIMGEVPLDVMAGQSLYLKFEVQREDLSRLMEALRRRGIVKLNFLGEGLPKQIHKKRSVGLAHSIRLPGDSSPPQEPQYEDKIKHVEKVYETNVQDGTVPVLVPSEPDPRSVAQVPSQSDVKNKYIQKPGKHSGAKCAPQAIPGPRPMSKPVNNAVLIPATLPRRSLAEVIPPPVVHASVFGEIDEELSELSDEPISKPITRARLGTHSTRSVTAKSPLDLSPVLPVIKRTAKRRLVVDSDEEIQTTTKVVHKAAAVSTQDTKAEATPAGVVKIPHIDDKRSPTTHSSTILKDAFHPEINLPPVLQKPSTPSNGGNHPEQAANAAKPCSGEDVSSVSPCDDVPTIQLLPEATAKPISPVELTLVARGRTASHVSPSRFPGSPDPLSKLAGTRRKREDMKSPTRVPAALDRPSRKKPRKSTTSIKIERPDGVNESTSHLEPSTASTVFAKNTKKYGKRIKVSSPIPPGNVDFDIIPGADPKGKSNARTKATRGASKSVPKKPRARQTRAAAMRRKNGKTTEFDSPKGISSRIKSLEPEVEDIAGPRPVDQTTDDVALPNNEVANDLPASFKLESMPSGRVEKDMGQVSVTTVTPADLTKVRIPDEVISGNKPSTPGRRICAPPKPKKAPWEDPVFVAQRLSADALGSLKDNNPQEEVPLDPIQDIAPDEIYEVLFDDYIECSMSLKGSQDPILPASPTSPPLLSAPCNLPVCIDLTQDLEECDQVARKPPVSIDLTQDLAFVKDLQRSTNDDQVAKNVCMPTNNVMHLAESSKKSASSPYPVAVSKHTPVVDKSNRLEDSMTGSRDATLLSPSVSVYQRRPRVSFASPLITRPNYKDTLQASSKTVLTPDVLSNNHSGIESHTHEVTMHSPKGPILDRGMVPDDGIESPPRQNPSFSRARRDDIGSRSLQSPSFLKMNSNLVRPSAQSQPEKRAKNSSWDSGCRNTRSDEFNDIQDIVNVLDDIQNVIVKGIANKFKSVSKDVRAMRNELLYDAGEGLRLMVDAYARQFNLFVALEEDYSEYRATMIRHWEDLIKSSECLQEDLKNAVQEHDRHVSSKSFPKSLMLR